MQKNNTINSNNTQSQRKSTNSDLTRFGLFAYVLGARKRGFLLILVNQYNFTALVIKRGLPLCYTLFYKTLEIRSTLK